MWEKRIRHDGLKAYRVVRGQTESEVDLKASLQEAIWKERWHKKVNREQADRNRFAAKEVAIERTMELEAQRDVIANLLSSVCSSDTTLDWQSLKNRANYPVSAPAKPKQQPMPSPTIFEDVVETPKIVVAELSLIDKIIPTLRRKKIAAAAKLTDQYASEAWDRRSQRAYERLKVEEKDRKAREAIIASNEAAQKNYLQSLSAWEQAKRGFEEEQIKAHAEVDRWRERYLTKDDSSVIAYLYEVLDRSQYPDSFPREHFLLFTPSTNTLVLDYELPNQTALPAIKEVKYIAARSDFQEVAVSDAWLKKSYEDVLYQICLRTVYELFRSDEVDVLKSVVFNGWVRSIDRATGTEVHACVMSLEVGKDEFLAINLSQVDPRTCFKKLKGVSASKLIELSPVKPLVVLNREDKRFVEGYAVVDEIDERTNLAAMDWLDFENLIREVFEKEFSKGGGEVKITQASRDGGVDAIAFDPDPIRGGKIVIQAKRYTNTVGVSAVRDLYGTVHNEGANKGILVTTSDYGPDAYAFAKDKPLTLLSGGELLYLLAQHGHSAKIDIAEAKRIAAENEK
jgi:restriction system protein